MSVHRANEGEVTANSAQDRLLEAGCCETNVQRYRCLLERLIGAEDIGAWAEIQQQQSWTQGRLGALLNSTSAASVHKYMLDDGLLGLTARAAGHIMSVVVQKACAVSLLDCTVACSVMTDLCHDINEYYRVAIVNVVPNPKDEWFSAQSHRMMLVNEQLVAGGEIAAAELTMMQSY